MSDRSDIAARTVRDHRLGPYARTGRRLVVDRIRPGDDHTTLIIAGPDGEMADVEISADDASVPLIEEAP